MPSNVASHWKMFKANEFIHLAIYYQRTRLHCLLTSADAEVTYAAKNKTCVDLDLRIYPFSSLLSLHAYALGSASFRAF